MEINVGDYVRGFRGINKVIKIEPYNESYFYYTDGKNNNKGVECKQEDNSYGYEGICFTYDNYDIKSIVTKEQFEQNCYKVEKER